MKNYKKEFNKLLSLVKKDVPFSFARFSDGEVTILRNKTVVLAEDHFIQGDIHGDHKVYANSYMPEEQKSFIPSENKIQYEKLTEAFKFKKYNYIKGIPGQNSLDGGESWKFCVKLYGEDNWEDLSFCNVMINGNYSRFIKEMLPLFSEKNIVLVANENSKLDRLPFKVKKFFPIGSNCMVNDFNLPEKISEWIKENNISNHLFLFSAASLSNFLCYDLFKNHDNNQYMDIGSSLGPLLQLEGWKSSRTYLLAHWGNVDHPVLHEEDIWN
tara:strand:- start:4258 stop:5067 length:810 start_codon:yes stop_codon:yes gene_type:complete